MHRGTWYWETADRLTSRRGGLAGVVRRFLQCDSLKSVSDPMCVVKRDSMWSKKYKMKMPRSTKLDLYKVPPGSDGVRFHQFDLAVDERYVWRQSGRQLVHEGIIDRGLVVK